MKDLHKHREVLEYWHKRFKTSYEGGSSIDKETVDTLNYFISLSNTLEKIEGSGVLPRELDGKHKNCWDIDRDYCITHQEDVDLHPERINGHNTCRNEIKLRLLKKGIKVDE